MNCAKACGVSAAGFACLLGHKSLRILRAFPGGNKVHTEIKQCFREWQPSRRWVREINQPCKIAIGAGKDAMCYVNPDETLNSRRVPFFAAKH
jgi:hypothetical protein